MQSQSKQWGDHCENIDSNTSNQTVGHNHIAKNVQFEIAND